MGCTRSLIVLIHGQVRFTLVPTLRVGTSVICLHHWKPGGVCNSSVNRCRPGMPMTAAASGRSRFQVDRVAGPAHRSAPTPRAGSRTHRGASRQIDPPLALIKLLFYNWWRDDEVQGSFATTSGECRQCAEPRGERRWRWRPGSVGLGMVSALVVAALALALARPVVRSWLHWERDPLAGRLTVPVRRGFAGGAHGGRTGRIGPEHGGQVRAGKPGSPDPRPGIDGQWRFDDPERRAGWNNGRGGRVRLST